MTASALKVFLKRGVKDCFIPGLFCAIFLSCSPEKGKKLARVGHHVLYESDLTGQIENQKDTLLQEVMVRNWITEQLLYDKARKELSRKERDKSAELQDYYRQLLRYEYEKKYLETQPHLQVSDSEIQTYYIENKANFGEKSLDSVKSLIQEIVTNRKQTLLVRQLENKLWQESLDKKEIEIY